MSRGTVASKSNVLLIHGNRMWRLGYAEALRAAGFDVVAVSNGHGATELAAAARVAAVVTAVTPEGAVDGLEVTRRLRVDARTRHVRVVLLTDRSIDEERVRSDAAGCDRCLEQSSPPGALAAVVGELVAGGAAGPERAGSTQARPTRSTT